MYNRFFYSSIFSKYMYMICLTFLCTHTSLVHAMDDLAAQSDVKLVRQPKPQNWLSRTAGNILESRLLRSPLIQNIYQGLVLFSQGSQQSFTMQSSQSIKLKEAEKEKADDDNDTQPLHQACTQIIPCNPIAATHYYRNTQLGQAVEHYTSQLAQTTKENRLPVTLIGLSVVTGRPEFTYMATTAGVIAPIRALIESGTSLVNAIRGPESSTIDQSSRSNYITPQQTTDNLSDYFCETSDNKAKDLDHDTIFASVETEAAHIQTNNNQPKPATSDPITLIKEGGKAIKEVATAFEQAKILLDTATPVIEKLQTLQKKEPVSFEQQFQNDLEDASFAYKCNVINSTLAHLSPVTSQINTALGHVEKVAGHAATIMEAQSKAPAINHDERVARSDLELKHLTSQLQLCDTFITNMTPKAESILKTACTLAEHGATIAQALNQPLPEGTLSLSPEQRLILAERDATKMQALTNAAQHIATGCQHFSTGMQSIERTITSPTAVSHAGRTLAQVTILSSLGLFGAKLAYNKLNKDTIDKKDAIIAAIGGSTAVVSLLLTLQVMQAPSEAARL